MKQLAFQKSRSKLLHQHDEIFVFLSSFIGSISYARDGPFYLSNNIKESQQ